MFKKMMSALAIVAIGCGSSTDDGGAVADARSDTAVGGDSASLDSGATDTSGADTGCGAGCPKGFSCSAGRCALNLVSAWIVRAVSGTASSVDCDGKDWDIGGGTPALPDLQVCLTMPDPLTGASSRTCTPVKDNTTTALWNFDFPDNQASTISAGTGFEYVDFDTLTASDPICAKVKLAPTEADFQKGGFTAKCTCPSGVLAGQVDFTLTAK